MDMRSSAFGICVCLLLGASLLVANCQDQQLETPRLGERQQRALFPPETAFKLSVKDVTAPSRVDNAAVLQLQGDKTPFPQLATLPNSGSSFFLTTLKPCGIILPHVHPRATEQYIIISGTMRALVSEENGGRQNITFDVGPGQSFLVPQGLLHVNTNRGCNPLVFVQMFNNADPGALNVIGALAALKGVDNATIAASNAGGIIPSPQAAFALDQTCLSRCNLNPAGGGLTLSPELSAFMGVTGSGSGGSGAGGPGSGGSISGSGTAGSGSSPTISLPFNPPSVGASPPASSRG